MYNLYTNLLGLTEEDVEALMTGLNELSKPNRRKRSLAEEPNKQFESMKHLKLDHHDDSIVSKNEPTFVTGQ